jgi:hypothetical protein
MIIPAARIRHLSKPQQAVFFQPLPYLDTGGGDFYD